MASGSTGTFSRKGILRTERKPVQMRLERPQTGEPAREKHDKIALKGDETGTAQKVLDLRAVQENCIPVEHTLRDSPPRQRVYRIVFKDNDTASPCQHLQYLRKYRETAFQAYVVEYV